MMRFVFKTVFVFATCLLAGQQLSAQYLNVTAEPKVDQLMQTHVRMNMVDPTMDGYRVQVIQNTNRDKVREVRTELTSRYPGLAVYETYEPPFFKLRAGDLKDRYEAYRLFVELKRDFKLSFIVRDRISIMNLR